MRRDLPAIARGFYPIEKDATGLTFAWTRDRVEVALPGLDRRSPWIATVRLRGGRARPGDAARGVAGRGRRGACHRADGEHVLRAVGRDPGARHRSAAPC